MARTQRLGSRKLAAVSIAVLAAGCAALSAGFAGSAGPDEGEDEKRATPEEVAAGLDPARLEDERFVLRHTMKRIDGEREHLAAYDGDVILIVNVASRCGLTPQYAELEKLYRTYKDRGFAVLGFPANDFGKQEPGTNKEIYTFCTDRYDVTFPMFEKIEVTGEQKADLYEQIAGMESPIGGEPKWNFTKFLVNREGLVVDRFEPRVKPSDEDMIDRIEVLLAEGED